MEQLNQRYLQNESIQFLNAEHVALLLQLNVKTVRELTPDVIPGKKYGKAWRYLLSDIIMSHRKDALVVQEREVKKKHDHLSTNKRRPMANRLPLQGFENRNIEKIQAYDWDKHQEGSA